MTRPSPQTSRVVNLLEMLAGEPSEAMTLAEISRRLDVHRASCHSMLQTLTAAGWLLRDPARKTYQLGPALIPLGKAATDRFPALEFARPAMVALTRDTKAHCVALMAGDDHTTVVDQVRAIHGIGTPMPIGMELPLRPPYGAAVAAWRSEEDREAWLAHVPPDTRDTDRQAFADSRQRGYTVSLRIVADQRLQELAHLLRDADIGRRTPPDVQRLAHDLSEQLLHRTEWFAGALDAATMYDVSHVSAPVFDHDEQLALVLTLVPVDRTMTGAAIDGIGRRLATATRTITGALGGAEPPI